MKRLVSPLKLRTLASGERERKVTWLELFFDLIFVAAVAQVAAPLRTDYTLMGLIRFTPLFVLIWWAWTGHTVFSTRFDTDDAVQRALTLGQMFAVAVMAANAKDALDSRSSAGFAAAYAAVRLVLVAQYFRARHIREARPLTTRYLAGHGTAALLWLLSAFVPAPGRYWLWALAFAIDLGTPWIAVRHTAAAPPDATHLPERFGLFTLILLGESVVAVMQGMESQEDWTPAAAVSAFVGMGVSFLIWWWYFDGVSAEQPVRTRRDAVRFHIWSYAHFPLYLGIVVTGVGVHRIVVAASRMSLSVAESTILTTAVATIMLAMTVVGAVSGSRRWNRSGTIIPNLALAATTLAIGMLVHDVSAVVLVVVLAALCLAQVAVALGAGCYDWSLRVRRHMNIPSDSTKPSAANFRRRHLPDGALIVLTAPLTETIDHAGYFIQMSMASLPIWLEGILNRKYPAWRDLEYNPDGSARYMPAGVRVLEASLLRHYARRLFDRVKSNQNRKTFKVLVGGSGGWQITQTNAWDELGVDCVVEGRSESPETIRLFERAIKGDSLPRQMDVQHPTDRDQILVPDHRTTFGVVEMTTGCGRRCQFCVPDLNPQIDVPKERIMAGVRANVREGNKQISLATEDMFIWGQVHTETPFYFPNREALLDLYSNIVTTPGVEQHVLSHATIAPAVVDPILIEKLSDMLLDKSPIRLPLLSTHREHRALVPLIGLETGSVRLARQIMPSKGVPFPIEDWPSVIVNGLKVLNEHNWFPAMTLIIGSPGETDEDTRATLDLIYEVERRGLFAFFIPSVFTPLHDTRLEKATGVTETRQLTPLQWQLMMKCWKMNLRPGQISWWGPTAWRVGAIGLWLHKLRKLNGPHFTWPLLMFASALPESVMGRLGKIYVGRPLTIKSRKELLETVRPSQRRYLRADTGDLPEIPAVAEAKRLPLTLLSRDAASAPS